MLTWPNSTQIKDFIWLKFSELQIEFISAEFWLQVGVIAVIFVFSWWLITPKFQGFLVRLSTISAGKASFNRLIVTLNEFSNTLVWLFFQWIAIRVFIFLDKSHNLLIPVASLLTAWLLIRIASKLLKNKVLARTFAYFAWAIAIFNIFGWLTPTLALLDSMSFKLGDVRLSPLVVMKAGILLWLSLWFSNVLATFLDHRLDGSENVSPAMRVLSVKLLHIGLITAAFLITFSAVGIDLTALAVFGGALGVGLGFGLQKIFSNLVSGFILLFDRSIKPGDVISVGQTFGWINHLSARYVSVITLDGIEHLIPNELLITERVENWSFSDNLVRLKIPVGIHYKADVRLAMKLCIEAAGATRRILSKPEPRCLMKNFGDNSVDLELGVWIDDPSNGRSNVISEILLGIWDRFHQHGIEIPYPQRDLHLRSGFEKLTKGES